SDTMDQTGDTPRFGTKGVRALLGRALDTGRLHVIGYAASELERLANDLSPNSEEREKAFTASCEAYDAAWRLARDCGPVERVHLQFRADKWRVLCKLGKYEDALAELENGQPEELRSSIEVALRQLSGDVREKEGLRTLEEWLRKRERK